MKPILSRLLHHSLVLACYVLALISFIQSEYDRANFYLLLAIAGMIQRRMIRDEEGK